MDAMRARYLPAAVFSLVLFRGCSWIFRINNYARIHVISRYWRRPFKRFKLFSDLHYFFQRTNVTLEGFV